MVIDAGPLVVKYKAKVLSARSAVKGINLGLGEIVRPTMEAAEVC